MFISKCRWGISFITVFLVMASAAVAQDYRGKVQGAVVDVNGAEHLVFKHAIAFIETAPAAGNAFAAPRS